MSINVSPQDIPRETNRDLQAQEAGRFLYEAIQSSQTSLTASNGTINSMQRPDLLSQDALEGLEDGKMSPVRRTFCLFVTFDLILTSILWIIYTQLIGETPVWKAFKDQVENYSFQLSLFDTVMVSGFRFVVLLLAYALFRLHHWWPVAITTFSTCAFLLVKCFLFQFQNRSAGSGNSLSYVLLIIPFVIAWVETWFLDFKVLPQEKKAIDALRFANERTPLIHDGRNYYSQSQPVDQNQYYSPVNTPDVSDDENEKGFHSARASRHHSRNASRSSTTSIVEQQYLAQAASCWDALWDLAQKDDWKLETGKDEVRGCVKSRHEKGIGKVFMLEGLVQISPDKLWHELVYGLDESPNWNPTLVESRTLQVLDDYTCITYSISAEAVGGMVSSRDFVNVRHWGKRDGIYLSAGISTTHPDMPPQKNLVRGENGAGGWVIKPVPRKPNTSLLLWINKTDLKGWLPQAVIDKAMSSFLLDYLKYVRKHVENLKAGGKA
ncbi:stAR-related lipid transfer protein 3-like isoform X2 [Liolophura sinensis]|uniref:stAR-related lipid transfer protein 3-like isoform X2 n=1 Tax=Liolophura sinensis TaxID=3198878 RepID=UPI003158DEF7